MEDRSAPLAKTMYDERKPTPFSEANTENATKFHVKEAVDEQQDRLENETYHELRKRWQRFKGYQDGLRSWKWANKPKLFQQDNDAIFEAIAGQLDLTPWQKERGRYLFRTVHFPTYSPYYTVVDIAFYVCVLVANGDYRGDGWIYYPTKKDYNQPRGIDHVRDAHEGFIELADNLDLDTPEGKIENGLPKFEGVLGL